MFDKADYLACVEHAKSAEKSHIKAFKLDDFDGIAERIGFKANIISRVDYFVEQGLHVRFLELSDLRNGFKTRSAEIGEAFEKINAAPDISEKWKREQKKTIKNKAWQSICDEFFKKWSGSIAVIERLYRKTNQSVEDDPQYSLLVVCKNATDVKILDELNTELVERLNGQCGMVKKFRFARPITSVSFCYLFTFAEASQLSPPNPAKTCNKK